VSPRKAPVRRCSWRHCSKPAAATIRFMLPNLLAGSERDYCQPHTELVRQAKGTRVVRGFGPRHPTLPGLLDTGVGATVADGPEPLEGGDALTDT
jgi:hypothetical protein